jgi:hypothetical protein
VKTCIENLSSAEIDEGRMRRNYVIGGEELSEEWRLLGCYTVWLL